MDDYRWPMEMGPDPVVEPLEGPGHLARQIMSTPAVACSEDAMFEEVATLLADREITGMPVVDRHGSVVGVISERDLARAWGGPIARLSIGRGTTTGPFLRKLRGVRDGFSCAKDVMRTPAITAHPDTPVRTIAEIMLKERINRIPIVRSGRLVGIVTREDILADVAGREQRRARTTEDPPVIVGDVDSLVRLDARA